MVRLAIISDTHVPSREARIPDWVRETCEQADHVVHAGDFDSPEAYETVQEFSPELTAVAGNVDPPSLDLPEVAVLELGGVTFVVTHGTGPLDGYRNRVVGTVERSADGDAVGICGHTHEVMDEPVRGVRLLNPGSATGAAPAIEATMYVAEVEDGELSVELREGPR
ncbi:metallophosphoesterase family protein [Haloarchaeobius sp. HME9146]|uniref:metallophosphoesterase family protein n=1 Tax=Haloarchaeobius sp. HME9146 TaxID=2978732 RepID=UPI0021C0BCCA|nr:metallophosphoesterase family protein [Haloarchaeobius sp. HME9146]MCT9095454.1 metallophosphatase family protein [Haloarchaeobius sp. HME9146]